VFPEEAGEGVRDGADAPSSITLIQKEPRYSEQRRALGLEERSAGHEQEPFEPRSQLSGKACLKALVVLSAITVAA